MKALLPSRPPVYSTIKRRLRPSAHLQSQRPFSNSKFLSQQYSRPPQNYNFYRIHGRAFFKSFTLAFFTYQVVYWAWLTLEAEEMKDTKEKEIKKLEGEVRLLEEGRKRQGVEKEK